MLEFVGQSRDARVRGTNVSLGLLWPGSPRLHTVLQYTLKHSLQSARGKTAYKSTATAGLEAELQVQDLKRRCKGGGGKETGVGLGESIQGLQRREVTMQATGGEERVL